MAALDTELVGHPDRYHGNRVGYPDGDPNAPEAPRNDTGAPIPAHEVMIVSTVDEPTDVQAHLATIYPGNLCVTQVDRSAGELVAVVERLAVPDGSWAPDADSLYSLLSNLVQLELPCSTRRRRPGSELTPSWWRSGRWSARPEVSGGS